MVVMKYTTTANVRPEYVAAYLEDGWTLATPWQCECGWSNTGEDEKCQRCFLHRPA